MEPRMNWNRIRLGATSALGLTTLAALAGTSAAQGLERKVITPSIGTTTQRFSHGMAAQEGLLVVGAPFEDTKFTNAGCAYVWRFDAVLADWVLEQQLFASDPEASANFGFAVAVDDDLLLVGASMEDNTKGTDAGAVYVFRYNATTKIWSEEQKLVASVGAASDHFGASVAIDGLALIVGAPESDTAAGAEAGSAYVFRYQNSFVKWAEEARLIDPDGTKTDTSGFAVCLEGNVAVVSSHLSDDNTKKDSGTVGVWEYASSVWTQTAEITPLATALDSSFGESLALDGDLLMIGAPQEDFSTLVTDSGAAYVFRKVLGVWTEEVRFPAPSPTKTGNFGNAVDIAGDLALVGSALDDTSGKTDSGTNWTYRHGKKGWFIDQQLGASDAATTDKLGFRVVLTDTTIFSASDLNDTALGTDVGMIYVYPAAEITTEITPSNPAPGATLTFGAFYGSPSEPVMVTIEEVGGVPLFMPILVFVFAADRTLTFTSPAPNPAFGVSVGLRSYKISETGPLVGSELEFVDI